MNGILTLNSGLPFSVGANDCTHNVVRGPGSKSMNLSLFRTVSLPSDRRLEFRVEAFNLFNWVNWGFPGSNVSNLNSFEIISATRGDQREVQLAVKFYF